MRKTPIFAAAVAASFAFAAPALAETWDMPTPYGATNFHTVNIQAFADEVNEATGGALEITVHPGGSLIAHPEIKNAVRSGQAQIGEFLLSRLSNENPAYEADSVPFLADSYDEAATLWEAQKPMVDELLGRQGLMVLYAVPWPPQGLYANTELNAIGDMAGLKFRAYNAATERFAQLAGAVPTQVEVADLAQAFSTGRVDAMITSPSTGANTSAWDYLTHYYDIQSWMPKNVIVVNKAAFDALPAEVRDAVKAAAANAETRGWEASMAETAEKTRMLADNGIVVGAAPDALAAGLAEIGETMIGEWADKAGENGAAIMGALE